MGRLVILFAVSAAVIAAVASAASSSGDHAVIVFAADRSPIYYGEIYRVDLDGKRIDLSRSAAYDVAPAVSPDGKLVAFASNRGGRAALYTVHIDGTHLSRVSPFFFTPGESQGVNGVIAWSPDGKRLVAALSGYGNANIIWFGGNSIHGIATSLQWSPAGTEVAYQSNSSGIQVVTSTGTPLWTAPSDYGQPYGWSTTTGRLAVERNKTIVVYDDHGRKLSSFPGTNPSWSPNGIRLASVLGRRLQVRTSGLGAPTIDAQLPPTAYDAAYGPIDWLGNQRVRIANGDGFTGYDVADNRPLQLPGPFAGFNYPDARSADGREVATITANKDLTATLSVNGGPILATGPPCSEQPWFAPIEFTPDGKSIVYQGGCDEPNADIYAIGANGKGLVQLTHTGTHELEPVWSPDGTKIAYVQQVTANKCDGCNDRIWIMNADGSDAHQVTSDSDPWHDEHPSWSPDGTRLAFWRWTYESASVDVVPAAGGAVTRIVPGGSDPVWGPRGITFVNGSTNPTTLQTVRPDGTNARTVASDSGVLTNGLAVSRTGALAYLRTDQSGRLQLVVGTKPRVTLGGLHAPPSGSGLAWSPNGSEVAFDATDRQGLTDIWTAHTDGTHLARLTHGIGAVQGLSWRG